MGWTWEVRITNTGNRFGGEVAHLYLDGELRGFAKVFLSPGESKKVTLPIEQESKAVYSDTYTVPALYSKESNASCLLSKSPGCQRKRTRREGNPIEDRISGQSPGNVYTAAVPCFPLLLIKS